MSDDEEMEVDHHPGQSETEESRAKFERELDEKYPNRPHNKGKTLPFHTLFKDLFDHLLETSKSTHPGVNQRKVGPDARSKMTSSERRRAIIERYISRWRRDVGDDFYPAFRLIIPEKDRDRGMYGLKEKILGKLWVKLMQIDKNSDDGFKMLHWKLPGNSKAAGDFPGRCYEVISKRQKLVEVGNMTIEEVNDNLDRLSAASKEKDQLSILAEFYKRMNADELVWLIRIILRQMRVGATEKTFFHIWHPDAESLFNISSSLRRVCWELHNPNIRLESDETDITLMQCFQPQLAQSHKGQSLQRMLEKLRRADPEQEFWIEEKLDGERMQLHMITDKSEPGGKRFNFWSRKAKDYTYLYGKHLSDTNGSLTQFLKEAFADDVESLILDGEMITWDMQQDAFVPFGALKTAALAEQRNPYAGGHRPLFRVFDILLLNDVPLTRYQLQDRRKALERSVKTVPRRLELHDHTIGTSHTDVEEQLRQVIATSSEGLVLKNPYSAYRLDDRNDDWQKVKPEYMTEWGESLDCLVIGAFYGSGRRGGMLSSFMCGLRAPRRSSHRGSQSQRYSESQRQSQSQSQSQMQSQSQTDLPPYVFVSFFKVGGGMTGNDYATIRHETDGKWIDWDVKHPPTEYIDLGGPATAARERPDVWIKPEDSLVLEVKAANVTASDDYGAGLTLRFPRFTRLRRDKDWETALSLDELLDLRNKADKEKKEKAMKVDDEKHKKRKTAPRKKPLTVAGYNAKDVNNVELPQGPKGEVFDGLTFYIMTESGLSEAQKKTKLELEALVKANAGKIVQTHSAVEDTICVAARRTVPVASLIKMGKKEIVKPIWLFDCIEQGRRDFARGLPEMVVPYETERHLFFVPEDLQGTWDSNTDEFGDPYARDTSVEELRERMAKMADLEPPVRTELIPALFPDFMQMRGAMFQGLVIYLDSPVQPHDKEKKNGFLASSTGSLIDAELLATHNMILFAGGLVPKSLGHNATHIVAWANSDVAGLRKEISKWKGKIPRVVSSEWIHSCWEECTRVDEEKFPAR